MKDITIGQLAKLVGLKTSAIRYYEEQEIIDPAERNEFGYRIYPPNVVEELRFLIRAQHLGFSLSDIRVLLKGWRDGNLDHQSFLSTTENRYLELERQATELLTLQHELGLFLQDLYQTSPLQAPATVFSQLIEHICINPLNNNASIVFDRLLDKAGCFLNSQTIKKMMQDLKGEHIHVWIDNGDYSILVVSQDPGIGQILRKFSEMSKDCDAHDSTHQIPELKHNKEGFLLTVRGQHAFIVARLFLEISRQTYIRPQ